MIRWFTAVAFLVSAWAGAANPVEILKAPQVISKLNQAASDFVVIQLWSPICEPCQEEVAELNQLLQTANAKRPKRLSIIGIPVHSRKKEAQAFIDHFLPRYEQLWPSPSLEAALSHEQQVPRTLLVDRDLRIVKEWTGSLTANRVMTEIESAEYNKRH